MISRAIPLPKLVMHGESELSVDLTNLSRFLESQFQLPAITFLRNHSGGLSGDRHGTIFRIKSSAFCYRELKKTLRPYFGSVPGIGPGTSLYPVLLGREWVGCILTIRSNWKGAKDLSLEKKGLPLLAWALGTLLENHRLWKMMEKMERQSTLGFLSAGIIHEIRNPLTALSTLVQLLPMKKNDIAFMNSFQNLMLKELDRLEFLTDQSLKFVRTGTPTQECVDLKETVDRISQLIRPSLVRKKIRLRLKIEPGLKINIDPAQLESLIVNLLKNAILAVGNNGLIQVCANRKHIKGKKIKCWISLVVKDNGKGIDAKELRRIFDPYFTTNPGGTGLGLAICRRVMENSGGILKVKSRRGKGSVFYAYFPSS